MIVEIISTLVLFIIFTSINVSVIYIYRREIKWFFAGDINKEIDHVYAQAAKADEYEAKAEAFDCIVKIAETSDNHLDFSDDVDAVIKNYQEDK